MWVKTIDGRLLNLDNAEMVGIRAPVEGGSEGYAVGAMMVSGSYFAITRGDKETCTGAMGDIESGVKDEDSFYNVVTREGKPASDRQLGLVASALEEIASQGGR